MEIKNYPTLTCIECAKSHGAKYTDDHVFCFSMGICDICNQWKSVTSPSDFSYPKFTKNRDLHKIYSQLMRAMFNHILKKDYDRALAINYEIDEIIHEMYETGLKNETTSTFSGKHRRAFRERNANDQRAV